MKHKQWLLGAVLLGFSTLLAAQVIPPQLDISRQRVPAPAIPPSPSFDLRLQAPEKSATPKAIDELEFLLSSVDIQGSTIFSKQQLDGFFAEIVGKKVGLQRIREAAEALEMAYRSQGYFLTRVFIPPQQLKAGVLTVRVLEGFVETVTVETEHDQLRPQVEALAKVVTKEKPLRLATLERALLLANDLPGVTATGVLRQGTALGASELVISVNKLTNSHAVNLGNTGSNIIGPWSLGYQGNFYSPFNQRGGLLLGLTGTGESLEEVRSGLARYSFPMGGHGLMLTLGALVADAKPGGSLRVLDIDSASRSYSARLRYPLLRSRSDSVYIDTGMAVNRSKTQAAGVTLSDDRSSVAELSLTWAQNTWLNGITQTSLGLFKGTSLLSANDETAPNPSVRGFDPSFSKAVLSMQRVQFLPNRFSMQFALNAQATRDKLLTGELIAFGGPALGRGYDPSAITGDRGIGGLLELRYDFQPLAWAPWLSSLQSYVFADEAKVSGLATATIEATRASLGSQGLGVRWTVKSQHAFDLQVANARREQTGVDARHNPRILFTATTRF